MSKSISTSGFFITAHITHTGSVNIVQFDRDRSETLWEVRISRHQAVSLRDMLADLLADAPSLSMGGAA